MCVDFESLRENADFSQIYKRGKTWHCLGAVVFCELCESRKFSAVASKKVGNAIKRNRAKRLLRAAFARIAPRVKDGKFVLVAKQEILKTDFFTLCKNVEWALRKLGCLK